MKGKLLEETHYYPHGLPMDMMGTSSVTTVENRHKHQGNEYKKELGLNWMDFGFRQYDPQIGRFMGVDPLADYYGQDRYSPYAAMGNQPESMIDPNGLSYKHMFTSITGLEAPGLPSETMESLERVQRLSFLKFEDHESYALFQSLGASGGDGNTQLGYSSESQHAAVAGSVMLSFSYGLLVPTGTSAVMRSDVGVEGEAIRQDFTLTASSEINNNFRPLTTKGLVQNGDNHCVIKVFEEVGKMYGLNIDKFTILCKSISLGVYNPDGGISSEGMFSLADALGLKLTLVFSDVRKDREYKVLPNQDLMNRLRDFSANQLSNNGVPLIAFTDNIANQYHLIAVTAINLFENYSNENRYYNIHAYDPRNGKIGIISHFFNEESCIKSGKTWKLYYIRLKN